MIGVNCGPNMASLVSGLPLHGSQIRTMRLVALHPEPLPAHGKPLFQGPRSTSRRFHRYRSRRWGASFVQVAYDP